MSLAPLIANPGLSRPPNLPSQEQTFAALRAALENGSNFWNGGEFYGTPERNSLTILRDYFTAYPEDADKIVLNIKSGLRPGYVPDGSAAFMRECVDNCLRTIGGTKKIDMFECGRRDPNTPLKETLTALADMVKEGKIGGVALSEVNANSIREAASITRIVCVEIELSPLVRDPLKNGIVEACYEHDIPILASVTHCLLL